MALVVDPSGKQTLQEVKQFARECLMNLDILGKKSAGTNLTENYIGLINQAFQKDLVKSDTALVLLDYCVERRVQINNLTVRNLFQLDGTNPHLTNHDTEGDTSNLYNYKFYK